MNDYIVSRGQRFIVGGDVNANLTVEEAATALIGGDVLGSRDIRGGIAIGGDI